MISTPRTRPAHGCAWPARRPASTCARCSAGMPARASYRAMAGPMRYARNRPHALSAGERAEVLRVANEQRFADMPPARIVPMLADEGVYLASESTFARVLREHGQPTHRGRAKAPRSGRPPTTHIAGAAREVWCWDMTYLPAA